MENICKLEFNMKDEPKVVIIGGGTGLSILLKGLKEFTPNITAIVTVADDGGGSGILREDLGMLPPGDIRACLIALANTEPTMEKLMQYRFTDGQLRGQSFGNLFIAAMNEIYGSFELAIKEASNVLSITGKVLPVTLEDVRLTAQMENGSFIHGESNIPEEAKKQGCKIVRMSMEPQISYPLEEALDAIKEADVIVLGPGSLYTSIIPNLLVKDMIETIYDAKAPKVYICNVMTQPGETDGCGVIEHVEAILNHSRGDFLDYVIVNTEEIPEETLKKYITDGSAPVLPVEKDEQMLKSYSIGLISEKLIDIQKNYIRHDNLKVSKLIMDIARKGRR